MTIVTEELTPSQQHQHFVHEEQMNLLNQIQETKLTMGVLLESAILDAERREEFLCHVDIERKKLWLLEAQLDPKYRSVIDSMGSMGEWSEVTIQSYVSDDMEIDGPEIYTKNSNYLMTERLHLDRSTRCEMENERTLAEIEGDEAPDSYEGSIYDQVVKAAYDLKVYARKQPDGEVLFFHNIRILTAPGGAPYVVEKNFTAPQEWGTYKRPIYKELGWKKVLDKIYIPIKIGHKTVQRRMIWHRSQELKDLYYMDNRDAVQEARYQYLLKKYDKLNRTLRSKPVYSINGKSKIIGYVNHKVITSGGLNFRQSAQLAPVPGFEYNSNPRFNFVQDWCYTLKNAFMQRVDRADVKECLHVTKKEGEKKVVKRQVYATMRVVFGGQPMYVVVFADVR